MDHKDEYTLMITYFTHMPQLPLLDILPTDFERVFDLSAPLNNLDSQLILQDKMEVYKQQVAELSKKLQSLQTENETLEERNRLLEKVVQLKDRKAHPAESNDQVCLPPLLSLLEALIATQVVLRQKSTEDANKCSARHLHTPEALFAETCVP